MRTTRQHRLDRACLRVLANCGDYLLPDANLRDEIGMLVVPSPTTAELDDTIRHHDSSASPDRCPGRDWHKVETQ